MKLFTGVTVLALSLLAAPLCLGVAAAHLERGSVVPFDTDEPGGPAAWSWDTPFEQPAA